MLCVELAGGDTCTPPLALGRVVVVVVVAVAVEVDVDATAMSSESVPWVPSGTAERWVMEASDAVDDDASDDVDAYKLGVVDPPLSCGCAKYSPDAPTLS